MSEIHTINIKVGWTERTFIRSLLYTNKKYNKDYFWYSEKKYLFSSVFVLNCIDCPIGRDAMDHALQACCTTE